jgi:hypothetical protein
LLSGLGDTLGPEASLVVDQDRTLVVPLVLYSTITQLAYSLGQKYYRGLHYVWCAPCPEVDRFALRNPASSDPLSIYWRLLRDIEDGDEHSLQIDGNRRGLLFGASIKEQQGVIDQLTRQRIEAVVTRAPIRDFSPLLLVIPYASVSGIVKPADITAAARATSEEYIIDELPRSCFDVLQLHR